MSDILDNRQAGEHSLSMASDGILTDIYGRGIDALVIRFSPDEQDEIARMIARRQSPGEQYQPSLDDKLLYLGLKAQNVVGRIQQAYIDGKIPVRDDYTDLYNAASVVARLIRGLQDEAYKHLPTHEYVRLIGGEADKQTVEASKAIVSWAKRSYEPISTADDEMAAMEKAGLLSGLRVDLISIEPTDDEMWTARLAIAGGRYDVLVTFWIDDIHQLEENRIHVEKVQELPGTKVRS
jgi:hypothetical protein